MIRRIAVLASVAAFLGGVVACAVPTTGTSPAGCDDDDDKGCGASSETKKPRKTATNQLGLPEIALEEDQETPPPKTTTMTSDAGSTPPPGTAPPPVPPPVVEVPVSPVVGSCYAGTLSKYLEPSGCYQRKSDGMWFQCKDTLWYRNVSNGVGPFGVCTSIHPL